MKRVFAFIGFTIAITLFMFNIAGVKPCLYSIPVLAVLLLISFLVKSIREAKVVPVVIASAIFASVLFCVTVYCSVMPVQSLDKTEKDCVLQITDIPKKKQNGYDYVCKASFNNSLQDVKVKVRSKRPIDADYYDYIRCKVKVRAIAHNSVDSYGSFGDRIYIRANMPDSYFVLSNDNKPLNYYVIRLRLGIKDTFYNFMSGDCAALSTALITGDNSGMSDDALSDFRICGMLHLTAVSGLHTSIICFAVFCLVKRLGAGEKTAVVIAILSLFVYIGVADFSKSVIRSSVMITLLLFGRMVNKKTDALNSLGFAVFVICLNPFAVTDLSAVLTVSAVLGALLIKPELDKLFIRDDKRHYFVKSFNLSMGIFAGILPATWILYRNVSLVSVLSNVVVIPIAQVSIILSFLLLVVSRIPVISLAASYLLKLVNISILNMSAFGAKYLSFLYINISEEYFGVALASVFVFCALLLLINNKVSAKPVIAFCTALIILSSVFSGYYNRNVTTLYIGSDNAVAVKNKSVIVAVGIDNSYDYYTLKDIVSKNMPDTLLIVDCKYNLNKILPLTDGDVIIYNNDVSIDGLSVRRDDNNTYIVSGGNSIIISKQAVSLNNTVYYRNSFFIDGDSETRVIKAGRVDNG